MQISIEELKELPSIFRKTSELTSITIAVKCKKDEDEILNSFEVSIGKGKGVPINSLGFYHRDGVKIWVVRK